MNCLITEALTVKDVNLIFGFPNTLLSSFETKVMEWIRHYTARHGAPPTVDRLTSEFDTFVPISSEDPLSDIYERTLKKKRNLYTRTYMLEIQEKLKAGADPLPFIQELHSNISGGDAGVTRYTTYDRSMYFRKPTSFPYGIGPIDKNTGGISQGDLVYLIGRLGTGKTTFAVWVLTKWLQSGKKILVVSNENRADDVIIKIDSYIGGFNPIKKRTMEWTEDDRNRMNTVSFIAGHMAGEVYVPNRPVQDVKEVQSLIYSYRPDVVVVDGIYLMNGVSGNSNWEKITEISRSLKQLAEGEGVPILGLHQANRNAIGKRIEIEHIAYADALAQDADMVLSINPEEDDTIFVEAIKSRWGKSGWGFFIKMYWETMMVKVLDAKSALVGEADD